jgi:biotin transport system permease protein
VIALYRSGTSVVHRMPVSAKLLVLVGVALAVTLFAGNVWILAGASVLVVAGYLATGFGVLEVLKQIVAVRWLIAVTLITQVIFLPFTTALTNTGRVVAVVLLATLITLTSRTSELLSSIERAIHPLRHLGVSPARISLVLTLAIATVPVITGFATSIREAQRARGVRFSLRAFVVPLLIMSLKHADELSDSLTARGVE